MKNQIVRFHSPSGKDIFTGTRVDQGDGTSVILKVRDSNNHKRLFGIMRLNAVQINNDNIIN